MSQIACAKTNKLRPVVLRLSLLGTFVLAAAALFGNTSCEDKAIGRPCDILSDASASQAVFNSQALECPSRICLKPAVDLSVPPPTAARPATGAYCSASCSQDSDCDGQLRDTTNLNDHRCIGGFVCGIPFSKGPICCQKLCLCRDFLPTNGSVPTPTGCLGGAAASCATVN